ncbi:hypothetical protein BO82DRAFT_399141 [Aspergillus uvarum CBS 121591]|uniref:Uncharacterized protein n=1 Tax=Aspergillus uvarum CBS 121591 TaxID=1448315 RepID=A0A319CKW5_9EURO|nr:hypothetical protein BO82DRAFT_399141 [Aspergillus uvarum CBS 121591]PYH85190.1 hypothetical protein BO82DRAFT_399141 [Aspergillus uvarum CBS 121591]
MSRLKLMKGTALASDIYDGAFDVTDNELLGIKELAPADLKKRVAEKLAYSKVFVNIGLTHYDEIYMSEPDRMLQNLIGPPLLRAPV